MLHNRGMTAAQFTDGLVADIDVDRLSIFDADIEFEVLLALARRFKHPWPYLLVDEPEQAVRHGVDNRTVANQRHPLSPTLIEQLAAVSAMLTSADELFAGRYSLPQGTFSTMSPPADMGRVIRSHLRVDDAAQLSTRGDYEALRLWSHAIQARGIYVSMRRLDDPTVRAFSLSSATNAVIVADTEDVPYAREFSLLHEIAHLILRSTGVCDLDDHAAVERFCNEVAAHTLMPEPLMDQQVPRREWGVNLGDDEQVVWQLSSRLGVSQATMLVRLSELSILSDALFNELEKRRQQRPGTPRTQGGQYYRNHINRTGRRFASDVVAAFDDGQLSRREASVMLELPEHNFGGFRTELESTGAAHD